MHYLLIRGNNAIVVKNEMKEQRARMKIKNLVRNVVISAAIFSITVVLSILFQEIGVEEHITTIFVFSVFLISLFTEGYIYGLISAVTGMFAINYVFIYPYFAFDFITPVNLISAFIMVLLSIMTSMLTTQIKRHEATKAESERERMRANLLRAVSHDLRTPLTTIYSASSTLRNKNDVLNDEQKDTMLQNIQEDSEWLIRMVENLLSITRIDNGSVKIVKTATIVDELIDSVMTKFLMRYPQQNVNIDIADEIMIVSVDTILIEQVMINLLENAVYHAKNMTELILHVFTLGNQVVFEVMDNGEGIAEEKLKHIFEGQYGIKKDAFEGKKRFAGIGLSVCASIIKAHGGEITAENRKSGGALFRFTLEKEDDIDGE